MLGACKFIDKENQSLGYVILSINSTLSCRELLLTDQTSGIGEELPKIKEETKNENPNEESKTPGDEYLSNDQSFQSQDPDELMNSDEGKEKEDLKPASTTAEQATAGIEVLDC